MEGESFWLNKPTFAMTNLYMFEHQIAYDVILVAGESRQRVPAHKFILISRSPVFYTMFCGSLPETGEEIDIPDIDSEMLTYFLRYLYTGEIEIDPNNAMYLMYAAKKYSVRPLVDQCLSFLEKEIDIHNVCGILEQAHLFDEEELRDKCMETIIANCETMLTREESEFCELCFDCFKKLVGSDKLYVKEEHIYTACLNWAKYQCNKHKQDISDENIRKMLGDILDLIRFPKMEKDFIEHNVLTSDVLNKGEKSLLYRYIGVTPPEHESDITNDESSLIGEKTFWLKSRQSTEVNRSSRFLEHAGSALDFWLNDNLDDAISFTSSRDLQLVGVSIFVPFKSGTIRGSLIVYDESNRCVERKRNVVVGNDSDETMKYVDILFNRNIHIKSNRWYTVVQQMQGDRSYFGRQGQRKVVGKNATFMFRKSPMDCNNTDIESGQILSLLYR